MIFFRFLLTMPRSCVRCARIGVPCKRDAENPQQRVCIRCASMKEKCEWPEVEGSGSGTGKGKGKAAATSPRAGEKKKRVKKSVAKIDSDVEIVAGPSGSGSALIERMDRLIEAVENLASAQWYTAAAVSASGQSLGTLVDECALFGFEETGEAGVESTDGEDVDQEEVEGEVTGLREDNEAHASEDA